MKIRSLAILAVALVSPAVLAPPSAQAQAICGGEYVVRPGDTLTRIARRIYTDEATPQLYALNRDRIGANPNLIEVDMRLRIPCNLSTAADQVPAINEANFQPAPDAEPSPLRPTEEQEAEESETARAAPPKEETPAISTPGNTVQIVFNKASAPKFILNVGIIDPLLADIERVTEGRLTFIDPLVTNRNPKIQYDLVQSGTVDGAYQFNGYLAETHPLVQITMHPMIGGTAQQTAVALWRVYDKYFRPAKSFDDVQLLGFIAAPPAHIWRINDAPVNEQEQLVNNNAWAVPYFDGLDTRGAKAVRIENAERVRQLEETPGLPPATYALAHGAARAVGIWNQNRTVTEIDGGVYVPTFSVFISKAKWQEISPKDRQAIENLMGETLALRSVNWDEFDNRHKREMLEQGLNIVEADFELLAELQDRARIAWEDWIKTADEHGISGFKAIEAFFAEMEDLKKQFPG